MASESVTTTPSVGDVSCDVTNSLAILDLALDALASGDDDTKRRGISALHGLRTSLAKTERDIESLEAQWLQLEKKA